MDKQKDQLSIEAARLYYQMEYSQQEIAEELAISRPTVSRLLKHAKEKDFVQITIRNPFTGAEILSEQLKEKFDLKEVIVAQTTSENYPLIVDEISKAAARYIDQHVKSGDIIGISWGTTLYEVAKKITPQIIDNIQVVQLKGSMTHSQVDNYAHEALSLFAQRFQAEGLPLPLPVIFDKREVKEMVEQDRHIQRLVSLGEKANMAIFTVGTVRDEALLFRLGYLDEEEKNQIQQTAVGDICSRFFDVQGKIVHDAVNQRTIGIELDELKKKETSLLVAGGKHKVQAIKGALSGNYANVLVTDYQTAEQLLK
ncbi:sugar-binding transcriptional regulator [Vagococcus elongatus]|uniref:RNA polymerase subunit sigma-70 n=1 Tax=Vagococcus elongatus TaxID=180344 RepID=A0A430B159_9ENTE|nr:sugar-binding transcriptional regulator [Vagococcus elongatus]RSU14054.1 RNA polymerase subunit sigma-70 [Vagococcus elongatus]